jgi:hypothetical protein
MVRLPSPQVFLSAAADKGWEAFDIASRPISKDPNSNCLPFFNFPFSHFTRRSDGHCTRKRKNWSHGQSNFASHCAMLRMEIFRMTRATSPVGSRFASLPLALRPVPNGSGLILSPALSLPNGRNLRLVGLSAVPVQVQGSQVTNNGSRVTSHGSQVTAFLIETRCE